MTGITYNDLIYMWSEQGKIRENRKINPCPHGDDHTVCVVGPVFRKRVFFVACFTCNDSLIPKMKSDECTFWRKGLAIKHWNKTNG